MNYDPDTAGQAATERSLSILLQQDCDVRVLALPGGKDPDAFIRGEGAAAYRKLLEGAPAYLDYLIGRARQMGVANAEQKLRAMNFLMPFVQRIPNALLRSEWASRIAQQLRVDEPVLREALRRAAAERRSEVKTQPALAGRAAKPAERRLVQMLMEPSDFRERLSEEIRAHELHRGLGNGKNPGRLARSMRGGRGAGRQRPGAETGGTATGGCCLKSRSRAARKRAGKRRKAAWRCCGGANRKRNWPRCSGRSKHARAGLGDGGEQLRELQVRNQELRRRLASAAP